MATYPARPVFTMVLLLAIFVTRSAGIAPAHAATQPRIDQVQLQRATLDVSDLPGFRLRNDGPWPRGGSGYGRDFDRGAGPAAELVGVVQIDATIFQPGALAEMYVRDIVAEPGGFERGLAPNLGRDAIRFSFRDRDFFAPFRGDVIAWQHEGVTVLLAHFSRSFADAGPYAERQQAKLASVFPLIATEVIPLRTGCTNLVSTWTDGTPIATIAAAIAPADALIAIWSLDAAAGRFVGWAPNAGATGEASEVRRLTTLFVCVRSNATLTRPAL